MVRFLIQILLIILAVWLARRLLTTMLGKRQTGAAGKPTKPTGNMVKDPVCGMYMDPRLAVKHETKTGAFYFCSEKCKNKFLEIPPGKDTDTPSSEKK